MRLSLLIFWIFLGLTSCADSLKYSMMKLSGLTSSIERSSDEMISASEPFKPDLSLNTEKEYESITWEKVSGPGDIIFSSLNTLNPNISANKTGNYQAKITILFKDGTSEEKVISFEWLELDKEAPEAFSINSPTSMQTTATNLTIDWQEAQDESPVSYELSVLDETCATELHKKELANTLSYTMPIGVLNPSTNYCLKIKATDSSANTKEATNSPLSFSTENLGITTPMAASAVSSDGFINSIEKASDSFLVTEPVGSFQGVEYSIIYGSAPSICDTTTGTYSSLRPKTSLLSSGDDTYSICVRVTDAQAINYVYGISYHICSR